MTTAVINTSGVIEGLEARLRRVIALHFDPQTGSPYWLERQRALGIDVRKAIRTIEDLALLGPMDADALSSRPIEAFIPSSLIGRSAEFVLGETGGTLGRPKFAVHRSDEFEAAFITPFVLSAKRVGFPRGENWLFIGPTGPHIIGKAARRCAQAMGSPDPFTVDFDPRWAKKLPEESFGRKRYLKHIEDQALHVIESQRVGVIFGTPPVLESLRERMTPEKRRKIRGLHFGGMPVSADLRTRLADAFPDVVMLSGYGNTLFGMMPELAYEPSRGIDYYPHGLRLVVRVVEPGQMSRPLAIGERGQVLVHRLDETQFIANMLERDTAVRIEPRKDAAADGFVLDGLRDPQPVRNEKTRPAIGLY